MFEGVQIVEDPRLVDFVEDWSRVRSRARGERRRRYGHRQNVDIRGVPKRDVFSIGGVLYMHPAIADEAKRLIGAKFAHYAVREPETAGEVYMRNGFRW